MFLVEIVPLTKIPIQKPQILSYFSARQLPGGSLILVPLGRRNEESIIIETHQIKEHKLEIKKAEYELRPIKKIISPAPLLTNKQIKLALWLGQYYFTSPGLFLKMTLPKSVKSQKTKTNFAEASSISAIASREPKKGDLLQANSMATIGSIESEMIKQRLFLVPTVPQANQLTKVYPKNKVAIIHSGLKSRQIQENWQKIAEGKAQIIIGTRLAIFAPFVNLKQIIIEDETNPHHRSWDMFPHFRVHEVAQKLAEIFDAKLTLKSALLSVEAFYFYEVRLPNLEVGLRNIKTELIDLRQELREGNFSIFSRQLQEAVAKNLENKKQIVLFINRKGLATFVLCRDCGYVIKCPNCDSPMTYHFIRASNSGSNHVSTDLKPALICHHCGHQSSPPALCPKCQSHRIKAFGTGTQRVESEAKKLFKKARIIRLDSDVAETPAQQNQIFQEFKEKRADILIGTQMILGADLPKVSLVAVMSADTLMHLPDFRSDERLFQIITQLRKFTQSRFIIQTYNPQNLAINLAAKGDFKSFYQQEIETRKILKYPPFSQLIKLTFRHRDPKKAAAEAKILFSKLTQQLNLSKIFKDIILEIVGPAPAFISKQKGKYIWQIIIKSKPIWLVKKTERQELILQRNQFLMTVPSDWEIDVDPETLL